MPGGFWKFTPDSLINEIRKRSQNPNLQIVNIEIDEDSLRHKIQAEGVEGKMEFISEGGLWVLMRK
jgi:hypothetical protein